MTKEELYHIALDDYEHGIVIRSLNDEKTDLMNQGKSTDAVDDLIIKIGTAPKKKFKVISKDRSDAERYVSELLGKETIDTNTYGKSSGRSGNYSTNYQISGRELLTPDEVRMLDNRYAILFIRGERPVMDLKYDILKHPNVAYTTDGREKPYLHGEVTIPHSSISVLAIDPEDVPEGGYGETNYELLSDEDFEVDTNF